MFFVGYCLEAVQLPIASKNEIECLCTFSCNVWHLRTHTNSTCNSLLENRVLPSFCFRSPLARNVHRFVYSVYGVVRSVSRTK